MMIGILLVAGIAGAGIWEAWPWVEEQLNPASAHTAPTVPAPQVPAAPPVTQAQAPKPSALGTTPTVADKPAAAPAKTKPEEIKPGPLTPPETRESLPDEGEVKPVHRRVEARAAVSQNIWIPTNPPGATATLDGRPDVTCMTPCWLTGTR